MSKLTMSQIDKYLSECKYGDSIAIPYGELTVYVKTSLTESEKKDFVNRVIDASYINSVTYSPIAERLSFIITFAQMLTDLPVPMQKENLELIDRDKLYGMVVGLNIIENASSANRYVSDLLNELESSIKEEITFKNEKIFAMYRASSATDEAIEKFSELMTKGAMLLDFVLSQVELFSEKLSNSLTSETFLDIVDILKNINPDSILNIKDI